MSTMLEHEQSERAKVSSLNRCGPKFINEFLTLITLVICVGAWLDRLVYQTMIMHAYWVIVVAFSYILHMRDN